MMHSIALVSDHCLWIQPVLWIWHRKSIVISRPEIMPASTSSPPCDCSPILCSMPVLFHTYSIVSLYISDCHGFSLCDLPMQWCCLPLHKRLQHLCLSGKTVHVLTASTHDCLLQGRPEELVHLYPWERSSTSNWWKLEDKSPSSFTPWARWPRFTFYPGSLSFPARWNSSCLLRKCARLACSLSFSLSHSLSSVFWDHLPNKLRGLLPWNTLKQLIMALAQYLHDHIALGSTAHWLLHSVSLHSYSKERDWLFVVRDKLIFLSQAAFRGSQYAHDGHPRTAIHLSLIISSQEWRVPKVGCYIHRTVGRR